MRDHRPGMDPTPQPIDHLIRRVSSVGAAVRVTRPDWTIGAPAKKTTTTKKARRRQAEQSRRKNR